MAERSEVLTLTQIKKLKVAELRERLQSFGLPTTGLKPDLVNRLFDAFNSVRSGATVPNEAIPDQTFSGSQTSGLNTYARNEATYMENTYNQAYTQAGNAYPYVPSYREPPAPQYIPTEHMQYMPQESHYTSGMPFYPDTTPAFNPLAEQLVPDNYQNEMNVGAYPSNSSMTSTLMIPSDIRQPSAESVNTYCPPTDNFRKDIANNEPEPKQNQELLNFDDVAFGSDACEHYSHQSFESLVESSAAESSGSNTVSSPAVENTRYSGSHISQASDDKKNETIIIQGYVTETTHEIKPIEQYLVQPPHPPEIEMKQQQIINDVTTEEKITPTLPEIDNTKVANSTTDTIDCDLQKKSSEPESLVPEVGVISCDSNQHITDIKDDNLSESFTTLCERSSEVNNKIEASSAVVLSETIENGNLSDVQTPTMVQNEDFSPATATNEVKEMFVEEHKKDTHNVTENEESTNLIQKVKLTKNQKKKIRKKRRNKEKQLVETSKPIIEEDDKMDIDEEQDSEVIEIEYVPDQLSKDPIYFQYLKVFDKFRTGDSGRNSDNREEEAFDPIKKMLERKKPVELELKDEEDKKDGEQKLSKRKLKQLTRMTVADLKQRVTHPELVEMHDVTAKDPILLLHLKATRNSVPVPRHWCYKRKYLQGKRGYEKPAFKLPEFIRKTGIMEMRQALAEKEDSKSLKTKMREKIRPKMGKIDIDYQKLHDAFFKWQTKPKVTIHGDLYYEGKEFETRLKEKKPGDLSNELRVALGMPTGPNAHKCPPPWLIAMQRYGPPPSYPNLKIPGLNAPIPDGCSFGYHAGGWGKPPVDEYGRPLYGDVFGVSHTHDHLNADEEVDRTLWGEMESEEEEEDDDDDDEEEVSAPVGVGKLPVIGKEPDESGVMTPAEGLVTPSGLSSIPAGMETPDIIELRKRKIEAEMESGENPQLFTVLPEKKMERIGKDVMASTHVYDMSSGVRKGHGVEVALDPNELEMDSSSMTAKYEQTLKEQQSHIIKEDLSEMVAEHVARQKKKKQDTTKSTKKYKDFKF
ncbi:splicing factor 3B subunit 2-like protein [Leptotrombidium deliense]|uniref:Splicing factor 3B subunit 2-like protein n=1 Tax=Leptotrombidium deliense TaxID=299467 RepID=A0A443SP33_9ACAR|nr:splicing factor 3B subunit 2-like protein [Leptotrombidium deliense]